MPYTYERRMQQMKALENGLSAYGIPVSVLYTNLCSELNSRFFAESEPDNANIIDWDMLDYDEYGISKDGNRNPVISLSGRIRMIRANGNRLHPEEYRMKAILKPNAVSGGRLQPGPMCFTAITAGEVLI